MLLLNLLLVFASTVDGPVAKELVSSRETTVYVCMVAVAITLGVVLAILMRLEKRDKERTMSDPIGFQTKSAPSLTFSTIVESNLSQSNEPIESKSRKKYVT